MMYKVLVADDEVNIVEGIAMLVDWKGCHTELAGKAYHGKMAFDIIEDKMPDIVITDIKMPGMNGMELIEKVYNKYPKIKFVVLSGYDEFDYAKTAMQYGVKHYLVKPSNRKKIEESVKEIVFDLEEEKKKNLLITNINNKYKKVAPIARRQFLIEYMTNKSYGSREWEYNSQLFEMQTINLSVRLMIFVIDDPYEFELLFVLKEIIEEQMDEDIGIQLSATIGEKIVLLIEDLSLKLLFEKINNAKKIFYDYYHKSFTTTISHPGEIREIQGLYQEANECLTQRFYLGSGSFITKRDLEIYKNNVEDMRFDHEKIVFSLKSGNEKEVELHLDDFFNTIKESNLKVGVAKSYCLELFMSIIRQADRDEVDYFFQQIPKFQQFNTLEEIKKILKRCAVEIAVQSYDQTRQTQHEIIKEVVKYINKNISNESLSLSKIANEVMYMNPDYLGRLFKKEMGENFSAFLIRLRIEKAMTLIRDKNTVKIFEVAIRVGFGNNPRYFGQVFKKHTGVTPTVYRHDLMG